MIIDAQLLPLDFVGGGTLYSSMMRPMGWYDTHWAMFDAINRDLEDSIAGAKAV